MKIRVTKMEVSVNGMLCWNKTCPGPKVLSVTMSHTEDEAIDVKVKANVSQGPFCLQELLSEVQAGQQTA